MYLRPGVGAEKSAGKPRHVGVQFSLALAFFNSLFIALKLLSQEILPKCIQRQEKLSAHIAIYAYIYFYWTLKLVNIYV